MTDDRRRLGGIAENWQRLLLLSQELRKTTTNNHQPVDKDLTPTALWRKESFSLRGTTGQEYQVAQLNPTTTPNNKLVVLLGGLGMSTEAYFRIGEKCSAVGEPILDRLTKRGFTVIILDLPGIGKNDRYQAANREMAAMLAEVMPSFVEFLTSQQRRFSAGLYFLTHSLGGLVLNLYLDQHQEEVKANKTLAKLFKNIMTLGGPEVPVIDVHPIYPLAMGLVAGFGPLLPAIPYQALGKAAGRYIPYPALIGGNLSLVSYYRDFPPQLLQEMFNYATKNFSLGLAQMLCQAFWSGSYPGENGHAPMVTTGQRHVRLIGHNDPLAPVESLYLRLAHPEIAEQTALVRIQGDQTGLRQAQDFLKTVPLLGVAVDNLHHLDCSCPNPNFEKTVWPMIEAFLGLLNN